MSDRTPPSLGLPDVVRLAQAAYFEGYEDGYKDRSGDLTPEPEHGARSFTHRVPNLANLAQLDLSRELELTKAALARVSAAHDALASERFYSPPESVWRPLDEFAAIKVGMDCRLRVGPAAGPSGAIDVTVHALGEWVGATNVAVAVVRDRHGAWHVTTPTALGRDDLAQT